jgi:hypothetical protein
MRGVVVDKWVYLMLYGLRIYVLCVVIIFGFGDTFTRVRRCDIGFGEEHIGRHWYLKTHDFKMTWKNLIEL